MRSIWIVAGLALAAAACGGGGSTSGSGGTTNGSGSAAACVSDSDCDHALQICDAGFCKTVQRDGTSPHLVAYGPRQMQDIGVQEPIWFEFDEPMRIAPAGFSIAEGFGLRRYDAVPELSPDGKTLTLRFPGVVAPLEGLLWVTELTDLSGNRPLGLASPYSVRYGAWWPLTQDLTSPQTSSAVSADVAVDGAGNVVVAWTWPDATSVEQLRAKRWDGTAWDDLGLLNVDATLQATRPRIAANGNAVASAFVQTSTTGDHAVVRTWSATAGWSAPLGGTVPGSASALELAVAIESGGNPVVAFTAPGAVGQGLQLLVRRWNGAAWEAVGAGSLNQSAAQNVRTPSLVLDAADRPVVAFQESAVFPSMDLIVKRWDGMTWTLAGGAAPATLSSPEGSSRRAIAIAPDGRLAVAWMDDARALHARLLDASGWGADESPGTGYLPDAPELATGPGGLWAAFVTPGMTNAALRTDTGWSEVGATNSAFSDRFWCQGDSLAAGPTFGPVIVCVNTDQIHAPQLGVYAINR